jgi:hypothetical protein
MFTIVCSSAQQMTGPGTKHPQTSSGRCSPWLKVQDGFTCCPVNRLHISGIYRHNAVMPHVLLQSESLVVETA